MDKIVLCSCKRGNKISEKVVSEWKQKLEELNFSYTLVEDLCGMVATDPSKIQEILSETKTTFIGCQPKAMRNLLAKTGIAITPNKNTFWYAEKTPLENLKDIEAEEGQPDTIIYDKEWKPWYPVLDYDLCTSCQKCLNFCLFGVYKLDDEGAVVVDQPANCKDLCPGCARTCPNMAIIFPKHHESLNDGGEGKMEKPNELDLVSQIKQSKDIYKLLADRRKTSGIPLFKIDQQVIAEQERKKHKDKET